MNTAAIPAALIAALYARKDDPDCLAAAQMIERLCKEIDVLQGIAGAVSTGQSLADIKVSLKDGSRESDAA
jgi:hypothetical protein